MDEARVRVLLELAAGTEAPPSRVDVERARSQGRRKLRWRRASLAGGSVLAVVAVVVAAVAASGSATVRGNAPAAYGQVTPPRHFSPLNSYAAFGWLPPGESLDAGIITPTNMYLSASSPAPLSGWSLTVYVAGSCNLTSEQVLRQLGQHRRPELNCSSYSGGGSELRVASAAPPVDGHVAFWTTYDSYGGRFLVWQYAAGSWAALGPPESAATSNVIKVADNVSYGAAGSPIRFPAQVTGLPAAWQPGTVHFRAAAGVLLAIDTELTSAGASVPVATFRAEPAGSADTCWQANGESRPQTINGYQVTVSTIPASNGKYPATQEVCAPDADGLMVHVDTYGGDTSPDAVSIFSHMRLLGPNPANWTTEPLG